MLLSGWSRAGRKLNRLVTALALAVMPASTMAQATAFVGVNVVPMDREVVLRDQTVVVENGRISATGDSRTTPIPAGAKRIAAEGRYLVPGLADMHAHISAAEAGMTAAEEAQAELGGEFQLMLYVASGVTTARIMAGSTPILEFKRRISSGQLLGPRLFVATPLVDGPKPVFPMAIKVSDDSDVGALVDEFVHDGYDQIKVYNELPRIAYAHLLDEAAKRHIAVVGHVPFSVGLEGVLAGKQYSIEHFRGYDYDGVSPQALIANGGRNAERFGSWTRMSDDRMRDLVRKTVAAGTWNCPTFVVDDMMSNRAKRDEVARSPLISLLPADMRDTLKSNNLDKMFPPETTATMRTGLPQRYRLLKFLSDAGAGLLVGTDSAVPAYVPGFTVIDEIAHFVEAGLSPYQALRAATVDPARFMGVAEDRGSIGPGKRADMILLDANPLDDVQNLWKRRGVMVNGIWLEEKELTRRLVDLRNRYDAAAAQNAKH
jgi:imidazolonepropionase-like amidohydrolase